MSDTRLAKMECGACEDAMTLRIRERHKEGSGHIATWCHGCDTIRPFRFVEWKG